MSHSAGDTPTRGARVRRAVTVLDTSSAAPPRDLMLAVRVRTTLFFVGVLVALYAVAQAHTPRAAVLLAFAVYIVAAVLWVRAQYVDALDGDALLPPRGITWTVTLGGAGVALAGAVMAGMDAPPVRPGALVFPGVLATYLGVGHLISRSRTFIARRPVGSRHVRDRWAVVTAVLVVLVAAVAAGLLLLGEAPTEVCLVLVGGGAAFVPWTVSLLSEHAIGHLTRDPRHRRAWLGWVGALVAAGAVVLVLLRSGALAAAALLVLVALVVALASFTLADIAAVLAVVAFMGVTPQQDASDRPLRLAPGDRQVLVALGDSYMSGEGAATFVAGTDEGGVNECRRARTTWSMIAGGQPPFDTVVSFACSGADTPNIRRAPRPGTSQRDARAAGFVDPIPSPQVAGGRTQLDEYDDWVATLPEGAPARTPALVVLSIGGNDAGFSSIGLTCVVPGSCNEPEPRALWGEGNLFRVENRLRQVYAEVAATFPASPVAVVPYPDPIHDSALTARCSTALLDPGDVEFVATFLRRLNGRIRDTATDFGFHYVGTMTQALERRGLQLCDATNGGRAGVNFIGIRSVGGLSEQRFNPTKWHHNSLHPNERGHAALHEAFQRWLAGRGGLAALTPPTRLDGPAPVAEVSPGGGDCATYPVHHDQGCRARSTQWALGEAGTFAVEAAVVAMPAAAAAWVAAVAFFGWRRSRAQELAVRAGGAPAGGGRS